MTATPRPGAPAAAVGADGGRDLALAVLVALRPLQWTKNAVVLGALVFADRLLDPTALATALAATVAFCGLSSGLYPINDVRDRDRDRLHPEKRHRPVAAGTLPVRAALGVSAVVLAASLALAVAIGGAFLGVAVAYVVLMLGYTFGLKQVVVVDVVAIAAGFVLRAVAGAAAIEVTISPWLLACTALLALFLGFGKRRAELAHLADAAAHRANLDAYSLPMLDALTAAAAAATVACYALYTVGARAAGGDAAMIATAPVVGFAVFRYLFLMHRRGGGGRPEAALASDRPLLAAVAVWGLACVAILYIGR